MRTRNTAVAAVAALAVAFTGVAAQGAMATTTGTSASSTHHPSARVGSASDGRALFAGVFFSQGAVAQEMSRSSAFRYVSQLQRQNSTAQKQKAITAVIAAVEKQHPGFLQEFSQNLRSGDPRKVQSGIVAGNKALQALARQAKAGAPDPGPLGGTCAVLAIDVLFVVNAGAAVNLSVAVGVQAWKYITVTSVAPEDENNSLSSDERIAKLTEILAA